MIHEINDELYSPLIVSVPANNNAVAVPAGKMNP
jgi:hypothetical protein